MKLDELPQVLPHVTKFFPARYVADNWNWCAFGEVMQVFGLSAQELLHEYPNISPGWNLTLLKGDGTHHLWTTIDPAEAESSADLFVPLGWVKSLRDYEDRSIPLRPEKQMEFLYDNFRKQGFFIVQIKPEQRTAKLAYTNPLVAELKNTFAVGVQTMIASYNRLGRWEDVNQVVFNAERWRYAMNDWDDYPNGLDPLYRFEGSIRLDRRPDNIPITPTYLHPVQNLKGLDTY